MTTVLIIVCIVLCVGLGVATLGLLSRDVAGDRRWRRQIERYHARRNKRPGATA